jgi:diguanylate cyclase (GGDEF)-like protein
LCLAPALAGSLAGLLVWAIAAGRVAPLSPVAEGVLLAVGVVALAASLGLGRWQYLAIARPLRLLSGPDGDRPEVDASVVPLQEARLPREIAALQARLLQGKVPSAVAAPESDRLTGLLTSSGLQEVAGAAVDGARELGGRLILAIIDVERLREINATHSYAFGDEMLRQLTRRLATICPGAAVIGRIGGDRFALLIPVDADQPDPGHWPRAILAALRRPFCIDGCEAQVGVRLGSALFPEHGSSFPHLLRAAELAVETARRGDGRPWCQFDPRLNHAATQQRAIEKELRRALEQNALMLHYQPQIDLATGQVIGVEALLRWPHPEKGMIPPQSFIPIAEASGLIRPLGAWVLIEATNAARRWRQQGFGIGVSVNVSAAQLRRQDLVRLVEQVLANTGLPPDSLELELTESMFVDPTQIAMHRTIQGLAAMGVRLAIDDFGTGYSSLGYLKRLPVDKIKIDKSFVRELGRDETDAAIVRSIIGLARIFGKRVLAEGVEEASQCHFLSSEGCDEAQGYHFSRPMPEAACVAFLERHLGVGEAAAPAGQPATAPVTALAG